MAHSTAHPSRVGFFVPVHTPPLPQTAMASAVADRDNPAMPLSARNQFPGTVVSVRGGSVMSEVVIDIGGGHRIVSLISTSSAKRLKLKKGARAVAIIKATEVIVSTDEGGDE